MIFVLVIALICVLIGWLILFDPTLFHKIWLRVACFFGSACGCGGGKGCCRASLFTCLILFEFI